MGLRWRRVTATLPVVVAWMIEGTETHVRCIRGLPRGTVCVGSIDEDLTRCSLIVEHESFDELRSPILSRDAIPVHPDPTFRTADQQAQTADARYAQQMHALCDDLGIGVGASPTAEQLRVYVRTLVEQYRADVKAAREQLLPLQDRIAELETH